MGTDIFLERYSCRNFDKKPVENDKLLRVLEAARLAPSACNRQPWTFLVVNTAEGLEPIYQAYPREWIKSAPACIIAFGHHNEAWHRPHDGKDHTDIDLAIAIEHICLAATIEGLGTCWVCNFDPQIVQDAFKPAEGVEPIAIIPIGFPHPDTTLPAKVRKPLEEVVKWNSL